MQKLAVVHLPRVNSNINSFREKYDPSWSIIYPHITIVSPLSEVSENRLIEHVESVAKKIKSFPIQLYGLLKTSDHHIFLQVKRGDEKVITVRRKLYSGILAQYVPTYFPFMPHITLGFFGRKDGTVDERLFASAYAEGQKMNINMMCEFDSMSVIKGDGVNPSVTLKTVALRKIPIC